MGRRSGPRFCRLVACAAAVAILPMKPVIAGPGYPDPANSTVPCAIVVVPAPAASAAHEVVVVHRDLANNPVPGAAIRIDFSACGGDVRIAQQQRPGTSADCPTRSITQLTDADGRAVFRIIGGGSGGICAAQGACAEVRADGVLLATVQAAVLDLDGISGLTAADLSLFMHDFFNGAIQPGYCARGDYNFVQGACVTQELTSADLSIWFNAYFVEGGTWTVPLCPP